MSAFEIFQLFSTPIAVCQAEEDFSSISTALSKDVYDYCSTGGNSNCRMTARMNVLDDFPLEKQIIISYFRKLKNEVFRYEKDDFELTTSWGTESKNGGATHFHAHSNSFFSGVLYLSDEPSSIEFERNSANSPYIKLSPPVEYNVLNSDSWWVQPRKNCIIFFPSYLRHRITTHTSDNTRYSLAFNFFPTGLFGHNDSILNLEHK